MRHLKGCGIIALTAVTFFVYTTESRMCFSYQVYPIENGYGYRIKKGDKVVIQQDFIPTQKGHQAFAIKQHAEEAARLLVKKLMHNKVPALSVEEINSIMN